MRTICSMKASTTGPALTSSMTRRGRLSDLTISSTERAPMTFVPAQCGSLGVRGTHTHTHAYTRRDTHTHKAPNTKDGKAVRRTLGLVCHEAVDLVHGAVVSSDLHSAKAHAQARQKRDRSRVGVVQGTEKWPIQNRGLATAHMEEGGREGSAQRNLPQSRGRSC